MAYLKHLALQSPGLHQTLTSPTRRAPRDVHWGKDHEASLNPESQHIQTQRKSFQWPGNWLGTTSKGPRHSAGGLVTPGEWRDPRAPTHMITMSWSFCQQAWQCSSTWRKNSLQNKLQPPVRGKKKKKSPS